MTSLAKALSNRAFAALWTARSRFHNAGPAPLADYRVRFRIAEYAPTWSAWQGTPLVVAGQTVVDGYYPILDMDRIGRLAGETRAALEVQYQYKRPDGKPVEETETKEISLLSRNRVYYTSMKPADCVDWNDRMNLVGAVVSSFVIHEDTVIQQAAGRIAKRSGGSDASGSDEDALKFIQHVEYGRDVLKNKAGTCIDLAILYGSLCRAVGLEAVLYNVPGHCFPAVRLPVSGRVIIEPIRAGRMSFDEAVVSKYHKAGALPMDLPPVGEDPLEKWGIEMPAPIADRNPAPERNPMPAPAPKASDPLVGVWTTKFVLQGTPVFGAAVFEENGGFEGVWIYGEGNARRTVEDTGRWSVDGNRLTIEGKDTGTVVRRFELKDDTVKMQIVEFGGTVTFTRKK